MLMEIRGKTISYSSFLKKQEFKEEEQLLKDIQQLQSEFPLNHELLKAKNQSLEDLRLIVPLVSFGTPWPNK